MASDEYATFKSIQRAKRNATKRSYLKNLSADRAPKGGKPPNKDVVAEYNDRVKGIGTPEPVRAKTTYSFVDGTKEQPRIKQAATPTITEPKANAVNRLHREWRNERNTYKQVIARSAFEIVWHCFDGFDARAAHWIEWLDLGTRKLHISFTDPSKDKVIGWVRSNRVPWKSRGLPYIGDEKQ